MTERNDVQLSLNSWMIYFVFIYYSLFFISGNILTLFVLIPKLSQQFNYKIITLSLLGSIGMSTLGSSIFYIRKLYKCCINGDIIIASENNNPLIVLGTFIYYLARPLFSIGFSVLVVIGISTGILAISIRCRDLNVGFIYLTMFFSFFIGFQVGSFIKRLEQRGERIVKRIIER